MDVSARVSSKGQVTLPKSVRDALDLAEGDAVVFRVEDGRAVLARTPDLLAAGGTVSVPAGSRGTAWQDIRRSTRASRAARGKDRA